MNVIFHNRVLPFLALLAIIAVVLIVSTKPKQDKHEAVVIGALLPLSGNNAFYGNEIKNAIELAREEINNTGGIQGARLEVLYEDDKSDPKIGTNAMRKLIQLDKVPVVLGSWVSGVVLASAPVAEEAKVIVMSEAIAPAISKAGDYIFRIQPSASYYTDELIHEASEKLSIKRIAMLHINNEFGVALRDTVRQSAGSAIQIVAEESYAPSDQDFKSQLLKIKSKNPDALFIGGYQEQSIIVKQASEVGITSRLLAAPTFENQKIVNDLGPLAEKVIYPYHFIDETKNPKTGAYLGAYKKKFGVESGGFAPLMYDGVHLIADAMNKCGTDTGCIKENLYQTSYNGVSGTISFDQNGDPKLPIVIKTVKNGRFVRFE